MTTNRWNAKEVVKRLGIEYPALVNYALSTMNEHETDVPASLPRSSTRVMNFIIHQIVVPTIMGKRSFPYNTFSIMGVPCDDWLSLYKKTYEWIETRENINEIIAFKML